MIFGGKKTPRFRAPPEKGAEQKITTPKTGAETVSLNKYPLHRKLSASRDGDKEEIAQNALVGKPKQKRPNTEKTRWVSGSPRGLCGCLRGLGRRHSERIFSATFLGETYSRKKQPKNSRARTLFGCL